MPNVSVIVPVYGVEEYIERCAKSLFEQTLDDMEYIFVNDCTKDSSIEKLESVINNYPNRKSQIKILHHPENRGLPHARATGISAATGDYIAHCDSDDWCARSMYEDLYTTAQEKDYDVVFCDYYTSDGLDRIYHSCKTLLDKRSVLSDTLTQRIAVSVWNKLVKRSLYGDRIIYPQYNMGEDLALMVQLFLKASTFGYISKPLYYYYLNPGSISKAPSLSSSEARWIDLYNNTQLIIQSLDNSGLTDAFTEEVKILKLNSKNISLLPIVYDKKYRNIWLEAYPDLTFRDHVGIKNKIRYILVYVGLYSLIFKLRRLDVKQHQLS